MRFIEIHAYRIQQNGSPTNKLIKHLITDTSICDMTPGDEDHFLIELTNGVNLKVPGEVEEFRRYFEDDGEEIGNV